MAAWWEYRIVWFSFARPSELEGILNDCGRDGWELVALQEAHSEGHQRTGCATFKRQRPEGG